VADDVIVERAAGRLVCKACGNIQHAKFAPPRVAGTCDACGGNLEQREDDRPEVVAERLSVYHRQTAPLVAYYRSRGLLVTVDGARAPERVFQDLLAVVKAPRTAAGKN
jgi:adenylate kinase